MLPETRARWGAVFQFSVVRIALAFTGLIGAGRTSLARALFGAEPGFTGELRVLGEAVRLDSPQQAIARGLALLTENPKEQGLVLTADVATNISLPNASQF